MDKTLYTIVVEREDGEIELFGGLKFPDDIKSGTFNSIDQAVDFMNNTRNRIIAKARQYMIAKILPIVDGKVDNNAVVVYELKWVEKQF
jgi:hypothetical protein